MRKTIIIMALLGQMISMNAQVRVFSALDREPGITIDFTKYRINYDMKYVNDTTRCPLSFVTEPMVLEIGDKSTKFYSFDKCRSDSINRELIKKGESNLTTGGRISWILHRDYPQKGYYMLLDELGLERYACSERIEEPQWTLLSDSLTEIIGYSCHLATTTYRGRKWFAWYTDDIPLSYGPWKLAGLPGLILRAYDDEHQYQFETTGLKQYDASAKIPIDYKGTEYEEIEKATLNKQYVRYYADPVGFVSNNPNVKVIVKDEHGNPTKMNGIPYNPIER